MTSFDAREDSLQHVVTSRGLAFLNTGSIDYTCFYMGEVGQVFVCYTEGDWLTELVDAMRNNALIMQSASARSFYVPYLDEKGHLAKLVFVREDFGLADDVPDPMEYAKMLAAKKAALPGIIHATTAKRAKAKNEYLAKREGVLAEQPLAFDATPGGSQRFVGATKRQYVPETTPAESRELHHEAVETRKNVRRVKDEAGRGVRPLAEIAAAHDVKVETRKSDSNTRPMKGYVMTFD